MSLKLLEEPFWKGLKVKFPLCKDVNSDLRSATIVPIFKLVLNKTS